MSTQPRNRPAHSGRLAQRHQSGSILVQFALLSTVILAILATVQVGYMYYAKRDLQRIADLAALEAVNALTYGDSSTCNRAETAGNRSVTEQLHIALDGPAPRIECGNWNASRADAQRFLGHGGANPLNAARVTLEGQTLQLFPGLGNRIISAQAIASKNSEPIAAFSVGSQLLRFDNDGLLGQLTSTVGLDIEKLTILDKNGIANAKITPSGLLQSLGLPIGVDLAALTPSELASLDASLLDLIDAAIDVADDQFLNAGVDLAALKVLRAELEGTTIANLKVPLTGDDGILAFISAGGDASPIGAGLDVVLDVADLVRTQLAIANGTNSLALGLGIPGLLTTNLTIVEPPTIAIGPADGNTKARSAQVRLGIHIGGKRDSGTSIHSSLGALGVELDIPIQVDVVRSTGTLEKISCNASGNQNTANISVDSAVSDICIGNFDKITGACTAVDLVKIDLLKLGLLGVELDEFSQSIPVLSSNNSSKAHPSNGGQCPFNSSDECLIDMKVGEAEMTGTNGLRLGDTIKTVINALPSIIEQVAKGAKLTGLLGGILNLLLDPLLGITSTLVSQIISLATTILQPVFDLLDVIGSTLDDLLKNLGVEVGRAEVEVLNIECDTAQLVQ